MFRRKIEELVQEPGAKMVIDLRKQEDYEKETYPGAIHIDGENMEEIRKRVSRELPVWFVCYTGQRRAPRERRSSG